jgi:hypothetical protein
MTTTATRLDAETMISLYQRYAGPLRTARESQRELYVRYGRQLRPKLEGIGHFTAAPAHAPDVYDRLYGFKLKLGMAAPVHGARRNPMIFFRT